MTPARTRQRRIVPHFHPKPPQCDCDPVLSAPHWESLPKVTPHDRLHSTKTNPPKQPPTTTPATTLTSLRLQDRHRLAALIRQLAIAESQRQKLVDEATNARTQRDALEEEVKKIRMEKGEIVERNAVITKRLNKAQDLLRQYEAEIDKTRAEMVRLQEGIVRDEPVRDGPSTEMKALMQLQVEVSKITNLLSKNVHREEKESSAAPTAPEKVSRASSPPPPPTQQAEETPPIPHPPPPSNPNIDLRALLQNILQTRRRRHRRRNHPPDVKTQVQRLLEASRNGATDRRVHYQDDCPTCNPQPTPPAPSTQQDSATTPTCPHCILTLNHPTCPLCHVQTAAATAAITSLSSSEPISKSTTRDASLLFGNDTSMVRPFLEVVEEVGGMWDAVSLNEETSAWSSAQVDDELQSVIESLNGVV
ncbi:uncharacterized protein SPPG_01104 [Spizellomyces punctatus DAOM BR117]|uniref:Uncharacterized protein n=1 Tax=Spizellomyces punctatus (strain DAOM BR117) TaxID=645134 RepID=A0A0L0HRF3_SPIPD|nr:uncharacterized protein SPPG_01104 [Spizellomyces punctatus DAOM BR117]KND03628.1 hypothetical protein SPPG_01104 [Spizellomyces punctatus DAOM BR117]|eukprot:XP_016611667.1 hypothetical protein SPPG_01104 [Spizellomyces punctatus DAOM BR117]